MSLFEKPKTTKEGMKADIALHLITLPPTAVSSEFVGVGVFPVKPPGLLHMGVTGALRRT